MLQNVDKDQVYEIIDKIDYPAIRQFCLTNKYYSNLCTQNVQIKSLIEKKLNLYVDYILNSMITQKGYMDYYQRNITYKPIPAQYVGLWEANSSSSIAQSYIPVNYKKIVLDTLTPDHTFELWDHYDPNVEYLYKYSYRGKEPRGPNKNNRFKFKETKYSNVFCIDSFHQLKEPYSKTILLSLQEVRQLLAMLLKNGCIQ